MEVHAVFAACENMTGSKAHHTGDVIKASNGKTIEVLNTDAEGRLTWLTPSHAPPRSSPTTSSTWPPSREPAWSLSVPASLDSRNGRLNRALKAAGDRAGERLWELPMPEDYRELLKSKVADVKNLGAAGRALTTGLFLEEFVPKESPGPTWTLLDPSTRRARSRLVRSAPPGSRPRPRRVDANPLAGRVATLSSPE